MDIDHAVFLGMDLIQIFTIIVCPFLFVLAVFLAITAGKDKVELKEGPKDFGDVSPTGN